MGRSLSERKTHYLHSGKKGRAPGWPWLPAWGRNPETVREEVWAVVWINSVNTLTNPELQIL